MLNIYLGAPLFTDGERLFNNKVAKEIRRLKGVDVYVPQENADINDKTSFASSIDILKSDLAKLSKSDVMIAILDGQVIDPGVAAEMGYALAEGITVLGLITDIRTKGWSNELKVRNSMELGENDFFYHNKFVTGICQVDNNMLFDRVEDIVSYVARLVPEEKKVTNNTNTADIYVDGSFMSSIDNKYAGWSYTIQGEHFNSEDYGVIKHEGMNQVMGEITATMRAIDFCVAWDIKNPTIYYDYNGIEKWATGDWKANKKGTKAYQDFMSNALFNGIKPTFVHVKGHSGNEGNERADELAKHALKEHFGK